MPKYSYKCSECDKITILYHGINDLKTDCSLCNSKSTLKRLPSKFVLHKNEGQKKVGSVVKSSIEEFKRDLENEKEELRSEFFSPDE
tara:strand:- start:1809 stop:2069 length:261 start_codon:yes stop_codon:yes gene_type:complete